MPRATLCDFCGRGPLAWQMEEIAFRQWSDKGYIRGRVTLPVGTCAHCQMKSLDNDSNLAFDAAFRREYDKL